MYLTRMHNTIATIKKRDNALTNNVVSNVIEF